MATIKGKWMWNKWIENPTNVNAYSDINFRSSGEYFDSLRIETFAIPTHVEIYYGDKQVTSHWINYPGDEFSGDDYEVICEFDEKYRIMDFGETEQEISEELYEFIFANATEYSPIAEKLAEVANNVPKVFEAGKKAEHDAFWDIYQENGNRTNYEYGKFDLGWNDENFKPKYNIKPVGAAGNLFRTTKITDLDGALKKCGVVLDTSKATSLNNAFNSPALTILPTISMESITTTTGSAMKIGGKIHTIRELIANIDTIFSVDAFSSAIELENITFEGVIGNDIDLRNCTKLTEASIRSIVECLSDNTTAGNTLTLSKEAVDEAFTWSTEIDGEILVIPGTHEDNPYWPPLRDSKSNWTITLYKEE